MNFDATTVIINPDKVTANAGIEGNNNLHAKGTPNPNINNLGYLIPNCINTAPNTAGTA